MLPFEGQSLVQNYSYSTFNEEKKKKKKERRIPVLFKPSIQKMQVGSLGDCGGIAGCCGYGCCPFLKKRLNVSAMFQKDQSFTSYLIESRVVSTVVPGHH